jgi:hypothetical protein
MPEDVRTLPEILREAGYNTTCVGFSATPPRAASTSTSTSPAGAPGTRAAAQGQNLNEVAIPELDRLAKARQALLPVPAPHGPALALPAAAPFERMFYHGNERPGNPRWSR